MTTGNSAREVRIVLIDAAGDRYVLPRERVRDARATRRRIGVFTPPGGVAARLTGDDAATSFELRVAFSISEIEAQDDPIEGLWDLLYELRDKAESAVAVVHEANTGNAITDGSGTPITDSDGDEIASSRGYGIAVLGVRERSEEVYGGDARYRSVEIAFLSKFGEATDGVPLTAAHYALYDKVL